MWTTHAQLENSLYRVKIGVFVPMFKFNTPTEGVEHNRGLDEIF